MRLYFTTNKEKGISIGTSVSGEIFFENLVHCFADQVFMIPASYGNLTDRRKVLYSIHLRYLTKKGVLVCLGGVLGGTNFCPEINNHPSICWLISVLFLT
jgi:hypothetical protein